MVAFLLPAYNEERTILDVLRRIDPFADLIVVVDDGSRDSSGRLVRDWCLVHPKVALLSHPTNRGMSGALRTGFVYLTERMRAGALSPDDIVVTIDADGQHTPEESVAARRAMEVRGVDVLLTCRDLSGYPLSKRIGNWGLSLWARLLSGYPFRDVECGFRLMRLAVVADILPFYTGRAYGCAQELGILPVCRGWRLDNTFPTSVAFYRKGARIRDGVTNLVMGLVAFTRVTFGLRGLVEGDGFTLVWEPDAPARHSAP
jgi:glycosyltransferase involved in cell wall biosynthesis